MNGLLIGAEQSYPKKVCLLWLSRLLNGRLRDNRHRLYHRADNRNVPADNNMAERELRRLLIARKVSFDAHSDAGAHGK